jgi:hypothetical protein
VETFQNFGRASVLSIIISTPTAYFVVFEAAGTAVLVHGFLFPIIGTDGKVLPEIMLYSSKLINKI